MECQKCIACQKRDPKFNILECNHKICYKCYDRVRGICPHCSKIKEARASYSPFRPESPCARSELKDRFLTSKKQLAEKMEDEKRYFSFLEDGIRQLEDLQSSGACSDTAVVSFLSLETKLIEFEKTFESQRIQCATVNLKNNRNSYLKEVSKRIKEGGKVFAVHHIQDEDKFAEISLKDKILNVHALSSYLPKENTTTVWFQDLKKCFRPKEDRIFLSYCYKKTVQHVLVRLTNNPLSHHFIKLCTGELGPVYKGASCVRGEDDEGRCLESIVEVSKYIVNGKERCGQIDYVAGSAWTTCIPGDKLIKGWNDGKFVMYNFTGSAVKELYTIIGRVVQTFSGIDDIGSVSLKHKKDTNIIEDCGIVLYYVDA